jgi:hypothetical protein
VFSAKNTMSIDSEQLFDDDNLDFDFDDVFSQSEPVFFDEILGPNDGDDEEMDLDAEDEDEDSLDTKFVNVLFQTLYSFITSSEEPKL